MRGDRTNGIAAIICASLVGLAACTSGDDARQGDTVGAVAGGDVATKDTASAATTPATPGTPGTTGGAMRITGGDQEIAQVIATIDQSEVETGQLAQRQARNAQVRAFARTLVNEHSRSMRQLGEVAKAAGIQVSIPTTKGRSDTGTAPTPGTPGAAQATGVVGQLQTMHAQMMDQLRAVTGAAFDSAFVNGQVQAHQQALDLLQQARSQASQTQLQQHIDASVKGVQQHLDRARELQQNLAAGAGTRSDTGAGKAKADTGRRG